MNNKLLCLLIFFISSLTFMYSNEFLVKEYNIRASEVIDFDPASSIYYSSKSIHENIDLMFYEEYITSLFIKAKSYDILGDRSKIFENLNSAVKYIGNKKYNDLDFYLFYGKMLLKYEKIDELRSLLVNKDIISKLDVRSLIEFNILKIKADTTQNIKISYDLIEQSIQVCINSNFNDLLSELYVLYGDLVFHEGDKKSKGFYIKATEVKDTFYSAVALFRLGDLFNDINSLNESYLLSVLVGDDSLSLEILTKLKEGYEKSNNYKELAVALEKTKYFEDKKNQFLIKQYIKLEKFGYEKEILSLELEKSNSQKYLLILAIVSLGVIIITLLTFLSILSFRLRGFNI